MIGLRLLYLLKISLLPLVAQSQCYLPDGSEMDNPDFQRCNNDDVPNVCCAINRNTTIDGVERDTCLPNGACKIKGGEDPDDFIWYERFATSAENIFWTHFRNFCTEQEWTDDKCLSVCINEGTVLSEGNSQITPCDNEQANSTLWCCGGDTDCCNDPNNPKRVTISQTLGRPDPTPVPSSSSQSSSIPSSSIPKTTAVETPSTNPPADLAPDNSLSGGAKAGIGVGGTVGALALFGLGFFIVRALHWRKKGYTGTGKESPVNNETPFEERKTPVESYAMEEANQEQYELDSQQVPMELPARRPTAELPAPQPTTELP